MTKFPVVDPEALIIEYERKIGRNIADMDRSMMLECIGLANNAYYHAHIKGDESKENYMEFANDGYIEIGGCPMDWEYV